MNQSINVILFLLLTIGLFQSCDNEISVPEFKANLVVNSTFSTENLFTVNVTQSRNILDPASSIDFVSGASVEIKDITTGITHELEYMEEGNYSLPGFLPVYGSEYEIEVNAEGFEAVTAMSRVPYSVFIDFKKRPVFHEGEVATEIDLSFSDETNDENFIVWEIVQGYNSPVYDAFDFSDIGDNPVLLTSDFESSESVLPDQTLQSRVFLNNPITDGTFATNFIAPVNPASAASSGNTEEDRMYLRVMTVSPQLYEYLKSIEIYRLTGKANSSISTPLDIYSNVDGGLGIFAGFSEMYFELN